MIFKRFVLFGWFGFHPSPHFSEGCQNLVHPRLMGGCELELLILLLLIPGSWDDRCVPPCLVCGVLGSELRGLCMLQTPVCV